jgi:hypothetical protein
LVYSGGIILRIREWVTKTSGDTVVIVVDIAK